LKKLIYLFPVLSCLFFSCAKNNNSLSTSGTDTTGTGTPIGNYIAYQTKSLLQLTYAQQTSAAPYDSIFTSFVYDQQSRLLTIITGEWSNASGISIINNTLTNVTYSQDTVTYSIHLNGDGAVSLQTIFFLNSSTSLIDSAVHQVAGSNVWYTTEREKYTYNNGYASNADTTFYNAITGAVTGTSNAVLTWSAGDLSSVSDKTSTGNTIVTTYTYSATAPAPVVTALSGPLYVKGISLAKDYPQTKTINVNGNLFQNWTFTFTTDALNRIASTKWIVTGPAFPNFPYVTTSSVYF
jgi:predicted secreted protein